jgi:hypothetical protein
MALKPLLLTISMQLSDAEALLGGLEASAVF